MINFGCDSRFILILMFWGAFSVLSFAQSPFDPSIQTNQLADGTTFKVWEKEQHYTTTYYVDKHHPNASDTNSGSQKEPFRTISKAAEVLRPGERVLMKEGVYRETVEPARGGSGPKNLITYQAAEGEEVVVKGSVILPHNNWEKGQGWKYYPKDKLTEKEKDRVNVWQYELEDLDFNGYNPFGMANLMHDRSWLQIKKKQVDMTPHFKRRGMIFLDGKPIEQVIKWRKLYQKDSGAFWVEHNGLRIHVKFPEGKTPEDYQIEAAIKEQLFAPEDYGCDYIKVKGITFKHAANGFPVPQRGMVSANRGHHWIIEDCTIEWANALGIDMGNEMWGSKFRNDLGNNIIRNNIIRHCGVSGLQAMWADNLLIEDNLFEHIGFRDVELAFESGAIKLHGSSNTLIRRNVLRHIKPAPGIWLDYMSSDNCRIVKNVFSDITTDRGGVYIEVSRNACRVDHNIFHKFRCQYWLTGEYGAGGNALHTDGSDSIRFDNNLIIDTENSGYKDYLNAERMVKTRGGLTRWHKVLNNVFIECKESAIEFANKHNYANGNVYSEVEPGYIKIRQPEPKLKLDLKAVNKIYDWEAEGIYTKDSISADVNTDKLELTIAVPEKLEEKKIEAGPFDVLRSFRETDIEPRQLD